MSKMDITQNMRYFTTLNFKGVIYFRVHSPYVSTG
jgi:hypothetical protein